MPRRLLPGCLALALLLPGGVRIALGQDSTYVNHPRLLFTADAIPALQAKVADGGEDDAAYASLRTWAPTVAGWTPAAIAGTWEGLPFVEALGLLSRLETAGGAYAAQVRGVVLYIARNRSLDNDEFASALRLQTMAFGYDLAFAGATSGERDEVRRAMRGYLAGMPGRFNYFSQAYNPYVSNHGMTVGASMGLAVLALWDDLQPAARDSLRPALEFGDTLVRKCVSDILASDGAYREGVLYGAWVMRMAAPYFEARRRFDGTDFAADPRFAKMVEWLCYELLPEGGGRTDNRNDSPTDSRPLALHSTYLDWAQWRFGSRLAKYLSRHVTGVYGYDYQSYADKVATVLWNEPLPVVDPATLLPAAKLFADRGLFFYRSGWKSGAQGNEMSFSFYSGKFYGGHAQEDQNQFTLYAYGDRWALDNGAVGASQLPKQTEAHNLILVDGRGQHNAGQSIGTDGRIAAYLISPFADYVHGDAKAAYTTYSPFNAPGMPFPASDWSWGYDGGNPVERADRYCTVVAGAGAPPYILVADDIVKDEQPHTYDWLMHTDATNGVTSAGNRISVAGAHGSLDLYIAHPDAGDLEIDWASFNALGGDRPTQRLDAHCVAVAPRWFVALVPLPAGASSPTYASADDGNVTTLGLDWGSVQDIAIFDPSQALVTSASTAGAGDVEADGKMAVVRRHGTAVLGFLLAEGSVLRCREQDLAVLGAGVPAGSAAVSADQVSLSRPDRSFVVYAPGVTHVLGPEGEIAFAREGDYVRNAERTDVTALATQSSSIVLEPVRPNPIGSATGIHFRLPRRIVVRLRIFDARGAVVSSPFTGALEAGEHSLAWHPADAHDRPLPAGIYFVVLEAGSERLSQKVLLAP